MIFSTVLSQLKNNSLTIIEGLHDLKKAEIIELAEALKVNKTVTSINLSSNDIGDAGANLIADALQNNKSITSLDLTYNNITKEGAQSIANLLQNNTTITAINLSANDIGDEGAKSIAAALNNSGITSINLRDAAIGDEGGESIAEALQNNSGIISINLSDNNIQRGVLKLVEAVKDNKTIKSIYLFNNNFSHHEKLADALKNNDNISSIAVNKYITSPEERAWMELFSLWTKMKENKEYKEYLYSKKELNSFVFKLAEKYNYYSIEVIKYLITTADKDFDFSVNAEDNQGNTLVTKFQNNLSMKEWLFEHGYLPRENELINKPIDKFDYGTRIIKSDQSIHDEAIERANRLYLKTLLSKVKNATNENLDEAALKFLKETENFAKTLASTVNNSNGTSPFTILNLDKNRKTDIFLQIPKDTKNLYMADDKAAAKAILDKVLSSLETSYIKKLVDGQYDPATSSAYAFRYDRDNNKSLEVARIIGAVKMLIDQSKPEDAEIEAIYIDFFTKYFANIPNEESQNKALETVKKILNLTEIKLDQLTGHQSCHKLINDIGASPVEKLFQELSGLDSETVLNKNKLSELIFQIYVAATTYGGGDKDSCAPGAAGYIIQSLTHIDKKFIDLFAAQEAAKVTYNVNSPQMKEFLAKMAELLVSRAKDLPSLPDFLDATIDSQLNIAGSAKLNYSECTIEQQQLFAVINKYFLNNIENYIPNYGLPSYKDYVTLTTKLRGDPEIAAIFKKINTQPIEEVVVVESVNLVEIPDNNDQQDPKALAQNEELHGANDNNAPPLVLLAQNEELHGANDNIEMLGNDVHEGHNL